MIILQSLCMVTPYIQVKTPRVSLGIPLLSSVNYYPVASSDSTYVSVLEDDYIQRFTNVARLYEQCQYNTSIFP